MEEEQTYWLWPGKRINESQLNCFSGIIILILVIVGTVFLIICGRKYKKLAGVLLGVL